MGRARLALRQFPRPRGEPAADAGPASHSESHGGTCAVCASRQIHPPEGEQSVPAGAVAVEIAADGSWFRSSASPDRVDLTRRRSLRLLLAALAGASRAAPGLAQSVDSLVASGWPGERLIRKAAAQRVYVALSTLRRMGLKDVLVSSRDGYRLLPAAAIVLP